MDHLSQKRKVTIMMALMAAMFFSAVNQTIVGTAMPKIAAILGGSEYFTWLITIYMLTMSISTILVGKLSDIYGRKPFILSGILLFMLGAFLSGFAKDIFQLIAYRGVQGIGAGIVMSSVITAIGDLFTPRERGKWTGVMMSVFGLSSVLGPPLGGWIVDNAEWKWLFWAFLPLGILAFLMILFLFPKTARQPAVKIDYLGMFFLSLAIIAVLLGFSWAGTTYAWGSPQIIGLFIATVIFTIIFVFVEKKAENPVLPLSLFKNDIVVISNAVGFIMNAGMMGALIYLPFFLQGVKGVLPTYSGYVTMPMSITMVVMSSVIGSMITKTGKYKRFAMLGLPIMIVGMLIMSVMNSIAISIVAMIVFGIGLGASMPVFTLTVQNAVSPRELGVATASTQLFRNLGGTIGIAVMGTVMQSTMIRKMSALGSANPVDVSQLDPQTAGVMESFQSIDILLNQPELEKLLSSMPESIQPVMIQMVDTLREALGASLSTVFLAGAGLIVIAVVLTIFLREIPLRTSNEMPKPESERTPLEAVEG